MYNIKVELQNSYNIIIDKNINVTNYIKQLYNNKKVFLIVDSNVLNLYKDKIKKDFIGYETTIIDVYASEENKSLKTYETIISKLLENNISRDSLIVSIGGGVVGDIAAFVASTILRGVKYICIPTTLLSQVDSSIGGKTGLNFNNKKNIIGSFFQPSLVLIDTTYLNTLSQEDYNNGLGEIIKHAMIHDSEILSLLQDNLEIENIIYKSLLVKKYYVEKDEFDLNERMILNFGHTFGHVIELEKNIKHGLAVIQGMILSIKYGIDLNITNETCLLQLINVLDKLNIKYYDLDYKQYLNKLNFDKKNNENYLNFIFLKNITKPIIKQIERD
ncbi:MAG: 3-dehydroquinate synthase family protein [bacterium]